MGGNNRNRKTKKKDWGEHVISNCHPAFVNPESGFIWCYYCDREWHPTRLKSHQEESHFACPTGCKTKPRHRNMRMLIDHYNQVHKRPLLKVPNAILNRRDPQVDVVLTTGVPPKAIQDRENTRNAAAQQQQQQHCTGEEGNFNNDKGNLSDKECLKYDVDRSWAGSSVLIQATERQTTKPSPGFCYTNIEDHSNSQFESETITHIGEDNRPKAFCFRHGLDGLSVEERRAKLSKYQPTAEWATKVVNALEILQLLKKSVQNKCLPTLDDKEEEVRFEPDGVALKYSSLTAWYSSSKKAFYTIHTLAFFLHNFQFFKASALKYIIAAKKANAQTVSSVDRQLIRQYLLGETVSVPKGGDLPRPSVAGIIEGPESSIIESECHRPISFKDDVEVSHHESEDVALQQNDDPNSLSLKSAAELNRNKNEQVIGVVEESSPRYKSDIVEMDVENVEDQHIEEKEASAVNSALPASSNISPPHHSDDIMRPAEIHKSGKLSSSDVPEDTTKRETHATHTLRQKKEETGNASHNAAARNVNTEDEGVNNSMTCSVLSPGDDDLKEESVSLNRNVKYDNDSTASNGVATGKRELCQKSSSSEKRSKQQPRASDYTLAMIVDILFEIEREAEENPGIRRHTAACKNVSKRHGLDDATAMSWWSAKDVIIQQSSTMDTNIVSPSPDTLSSKETLCPLPRIAAPSSQNQIIMTKQDLEESFGMTTQLCLKSNGYSSCGLKELSPSSTPTIFEERDTPPVPLIKESSSPNDPMIQEATIPIDCNDVEISSSNHRESSSHVSSSAPILTSGDDMDIVSTTPDKFSSSIKLPCSTSDIQEKEVSASATLPVVIKEGEKLSGPPVTVAKVEEEVVSLPPPSPLSVVEETILEPYKMVGTTISSSLTETNEDKDCCSQSNYTPKERKKWLNQWYQARRMQKDSTAETFAEAYGIPFKQFQLWISERKERRNKSKYQRSKKVDPSHEGEWSLSKLQDALDEECSNQVHKLICSKLLIGETVSVVRAFQVANLLCPNFLGGYNPPKGCISQLKKTHWFYQRAKIWYRAFEKKHGE